MNRMNKGLQQYNVDSAVLRTTPGLIFKHTIIQFLLSHVNVCFFPHHLHMMGRIWHFIHVFHNTFSFYCIVKGTNKKYKIGDTFTEGCIEYECQQKGKGKAKWKETKNICTTQNPSGTTIPSDPFFPGRSVFIFQYFERGGMLMIMFGHTIQ